MTDDEIDRRVASIRRELRGEQAGLWDYAAQMERITALLAALDRAPGGSFEHEAYDGSGLTVREGARQMATALALSESQAAVLVAEIRNALAPVHARNPTRGTARILALADELARKQESG